MCNFRQLKSSLNNDFNSNYQLHLNQRKTLPMHLEVKTTYKIKTPN